MLSLSRSVPGDIDIALRITSIVTLDSNNKIMLLESGVELELETSSSNF
jgi:hypothetical protein